ncbi:tetratricopeptide repeat protein [Sphingobacterium shayense]|uniref:tetratricopeptide repeat protein n=1 Tax=Sphingobacterium shayense TaxID=626343 RepID=UPI001554C49A|nr:tetratricopeptide repeat protein [Sphingobacterium shayense]NQD70483.1 tetratricopeptide repeat protein [Sphingobacterium shayense]
MYKKIVWIGACVIASLGTLSQSYAQQVDVGDKPYKQELVAVEGFLRVGNLEGAIQTLDRVIAKYPEAAEVYYAKALLFGQARNFDVAVPLAQQAFQLEPSNLMFANYLVELHKSQGEFSKAIEVLDKVIASNPEKVSIYREKVMLQHANKQSEDALATYEVTTKRFGTSDTLDVIKAEILVDLDRKVEAEQLLTPWLKEKSTVRQIYSTLGYIYLANDDWKKSIQVLEDGVANSKDNLLYLDIANAYVAGGKDIQAFESIKKAFEADDVNYLDKHRVMYTILNGTTKFELEQMQDLANILVLKHPRVADSHVAKGDVLWRRGNLQEARSLFLTAVGINKNHVDAWRMLINVELGLNEPDQAIAHGFEALEANPNNPLLLYFTGLSYMVKDDTDNARKMMESALDNSGKENHYLQSLIYAGLGDLYHKLKMADVSDVAYEEAIKLDSTNATAMNNYAYYLSERNEKLDLAEKLSKESNTLDPASSTFQDTYAWILFKQQKYTEAIKWMEKAMGAGEPNAVLYEHYGDILSKTGRTKDALKQWEKALSMSEGSGIDVEKLKTKIATRAYVE